MSKNRCDLEEISVLFSPLLEQFAKMSEIFREFSDILQNISLILSEKWRRFTGDCEGCESKKCKIAVMRMRACA